MSHPTPSTADAEPSLGSQPFDTDAVDRFERIARLARRLFDVPIAALDLHPCFGSQAGQPVDVEPIAGSVLATARSAQGTWVVTDTLAATDLAHDPLVHGPAGVRFVAACPMHSTNGERMGTLLLADRVPRLFGAEDQRVLADLARSIELELDASHMATVDLLTGLPNRRGLERSASQILPFCRRQGQAATLLYFDLDGFKAINDQFGHAEGDQILVDFAALLRRSFRDCDVVARLGGDEFVVLAGGADSSTLEPAVRRLRAAAAKHNETGGDKSRIRFSVGSATCAPRKDVPLSTLLSSADRAMYLAKRASALAV